MDLSNFDPEQFLQATTTEAATRRLPLPEHNPADPNGLYTAVLGKPKIRTWQGKQDPTKAGLAFDIPVIIDVPPQVQEQQKLQPQVTLTGGGFIDTTPAGMTDWSPGRNRDGRMYREATGLNVAGEVFNWAMLEGKVVKVKVVHEMYTPKGATQQELTDKIGTVLKA